MALSFGAANGDKDVMASIAARLMGKSKATAVPKQPPSAALRSMPPQLQTTSSTNTAPTTSSNTNTKHVTASTSGVATENVPPKQTVSDVFVKASEDIKMTDVNSGPSLFGSADQLAAARQFASSATQGGHKARPSSRRRLASKEPDRAPSTSSSSSTRSRLASVAPNNDWQAFSVAPTTTQPSPVSTEARSSTTATGLGQRRPAVTLTTTAMAPTPAPTPVASPSQRTTPMLSERVNGSNTPPSPTKSVDKPADGMLRPAANKAELSHAHPLTSNLPKKDEAKSLQAKQLADITNTFKERAAGATAPPHLRARAAAAGIPDKKNTSPTEKHAEKTVEANVEQKKNDDLQLATPKETPLATEATAPKRTINEVASAESKVEVKAESAHDDQISLKAVQIEPISQRELLVRAAKAENVLHNRPSPKIKAELDTTKKAATLNGTSMVESPPHMSSMPEELNNVDKTGDNNEILRMLDYVHTAVTTINARIKRLEADNFEMQKQLVALVEEKERRQFLGTDSAKAPFGLEVKATNGKTYKVQVSTDLKVYEFIRRIRAKAELAPMASTNPRVIVDGKVVGHAMMLGELGISNEEKGKRQVEFFHD